MTMGFWLFVRYPRGHFAPIFRLLDPDIAGSDARRKMQGPMSTADQYRARNRNGGDFDWLGHSPALPLYVAPMATPPPPSASAASRAPVAISAAPGPAQTVEIDLDKTIKHLQDNAQPKSLGYCARYVRQAINAGGLVLSSQPGSAKNYGPPLVKVGYKAQPQTGYVAQVGDIFVMQPSNGPDGHGHIAMFDGSVWISDFKQRDMWGGPTARKVRPDYVIYRPSLAIPVSGGTAKIDLEKAIKHLQANAKPLGTDPNLLGNCAKFVRLAINAGDLILSSQPLAAKDYGPPLLAAGYVALPTAGYVPKRGDIFVMQPKNTGDPYGHIAMYDGSKWISDAWQRDMWGSSARDIRPPIPHVIYRP
jgi:surface antigen